MRPIVLSASAVLMFEITANDNLVSAKFNNTDAVAIAPSNPRIRDARPRRPEDDSREAGFSIHFYRASGCLPVRLLSTDQRRTGLELSVDSRLTD